MHISTHNSEGNKIKFSKTEAMYFPAKPKLMMNWKWPLPSDIIFGDNNEHFITFTNTFKYLGCQITQSLNDETKIKHHIKQALIQAAALGNFSVPQWTWQPSDSSSLESPSTQHSMAVSHVPLPLPFIVTSLPSSYHKTICSILGVNMHNVKQYDHICNEHICNQFSVAGPLDIIQHHQFNQLGKFAQLPKCHVPHKFLAAWVGHQWQCGRPFMWSCTMHYKGTK